MNKKTANAILLKVVSYRENIEINISGRMKLEPPTFHP
jgi:hypothetical protein